MSSLSEIYRWAQEAVELYQDCRMPEAALAVTRAIEIAERHELDVVANLMGMLAEIWGAAGENSRQLEVLLKLRDTKKSQIGTDLELSIQATTFYVLMDESPNLKSLERRLEDYERLSRQNGDSHRAGVATLRGRFYEWRGMREESLAEAEVRWANRDSQGGVCTVNALCDLIDRSIKTRSDDSLEHWCRELDSQSFDNLCCGLRLTQIRIARALYESDAPAALRRSEELMEQSAAISWPSFQRSRIELRVRSYLLANRYGDPLGASHPALRLLVANRPHLKQDSERHAFQRLVVDFRLAGLRYLVGLPSAEDYYYRNPPTLPDELTVENREEFERRVARTRASLRHWQRYTQRLDAVSEATWRGREVSDRQDRLNAIVASVTGTI